MHRSDEQTTSEADDINSKFIRYVQCGLALNNIQSVYLCVQDPMRMLAVISAIEQATRWHQGGKGSKGGTTSIIKVKSVRQFILTMFSIAFSCLYCVIGCARLGTCCIIFGKKVMTCIIINNRRKGICYICQSRGGVKHMHV